MDDLNSLTISTALEALRRQKISPQDLTAACLRQIERLNPALNAFITVISAPPQARVERPQEPSSNVSETNTRPTQSLTRAITLKGIPIAVKDLFDTAGIRTTAGSKFFTDNIPKKDAYVVEKLKEAGA